MNALATIHAVADGSAIAACGAVPTTGWGRLHPVHGNSDVTCAACQAVLARRYMAAVPLATGIPS